MTPVSPVFQDIKGDNDIANRRTLTLENGNKIHFERRDPYGFWHIAYEKGQLPEVLRGLYTSFDLAKKDVERYLIEQRKLHRFEKDFDKSVNNHVHVKK